MCIGLTAVKQCQVKWYSVGFLYLGINTEWSASRFISSLRRTHPLLKSYPFGDSIYKIIIWKVFKKVVKSGSLRSLRVIDPYRHCW